MLKNLISNIKKVFSLEKIERNGITIKGSNLRIIEEEILVVIFKTIELSNTKTVNLNNSNFLYQHKWKNEDSIKEFEEFMFEYLKSDKIRNIFCNNPKKTRYKKHRINYIKQYIKDYTWKTIQQ
jgi:hypothetical protein